MLFAALDRGGEAYLTLQCASRSSDTGPTPIAVRRNGKVEPTAISVATMLSDACRRPRGAWR